MRSIIVFSFVFVQVFSSAFSQNKSSCELLSETENLELLTQEQFTTLLTDPCRYDKYVKPNTTNVLPVYIQIDLRQIEKQSQWDFMALICVQYRYHDERLKFDNLSSAHQETIIGGDSLKNQLWIPHIIIKNEKASKLINLGQNVFVSIDPNGEVVYSYTVSVSFYCWMNLKKFPFDSQNCSLIWSSWTYDTMDVMLHWDPDVAIKRDNNLQLTEFIIDQIWPEETTASEYITREGTFSEVVLKLKLRREVGYYIMDYFLPSILLVCTSWVSFWLQADATPPRAILGATTFLAFITLNGGLTKNLPKVSYIKASDVWFLVCSCFIFGSLAEFAFANVVWRRNKRIELKKNSGKYILRSAITPSIARKQLRKAKSMAIMQKTGSSDRELNLSQHYLTVHEFPLTDSTTTMEINQEEESKDCSTFITFQNQGEHQPGWITMTPQEVSIWIDRKARIVFPIAFAIFNLIYWSFVYLL